MNNLAICTDIFKNVLAILAGEIETKTESDNIQGGIVMQIHGNNNYKEEKTAASGAYSAGIHKEVKEAGRAYRTENGGAVWSEDAVEGEENPEDAAAILDLSGEKEKAEEEKSEDEIQLERLQEMLERLREAQKNNDAKKDQIKKRLNYNYRKVSSTISRSKNLSQASNAVASANTNLSMIRRKGASGKYDENEINIAVVHAKKMINAARRKLRNIKKEAQINREDEIVVNRREEMTQQIVNEKKKQEAEDAIRQLKKALNSLKKQREHADRSSEDRELLNADLEYLRKKIDLIKQGKGDLFISESSVDTGGNEEMTAALTEVVADQAAATQQQAAMNMATGQGINLTV